MDFGTIIIGVATLLLFFVPFIVVDWNKKRNENRFITKLLSLATNSACSISSYERWNESAIGIDINTHMLFFISKANNQEVSITVNLNDASHCYVRNSGRTVKTKGNSIKITDSISLAIVPKEKGKQDVLLPIYNVDYDSPTLNGELQLAEKWEAIANESIKKAQQKPN